MAIARKFLAAVLAGTLSVSMLAACSSDEENSDAQASSTAASATTDGDAANADVADSDVDSIEEVQVQEDLAEDAARVSLRDAFGEDVEIPEDSSAIMTLASAKDLNAYAYTMEGVRNLVPNITDPAGFTLDYVNSKLMSVLLWVKDDVQYAADGTPVMDNVSLSAFEFPDGITKEELGQALETELGSLTSGTAEIEELDDYAGYRMSGIYDVSDIQVAVNGYYWISPNGTTVYQLVMGVIGNSVDQELLDWSQSVLAGAA